MWSYLQLLIYLVMLSTMPEKPNPEAAPRFFDPERLKQWSILQLSVKIVHFNNQLEVRSLDRGELNDIRSQQAELRNELALRPEAHNLESLKKQAQHPHPETALLPSVFNSRKKVS